MNLWNCIPLFLHKIIIPFLLSQSSWMDVVGQVCVCWECGDWCCRDLMSYPIKTEKDGDRDWEGDIKIWREGWGGRGREYSELAVCSKTREQTPQSHSANPSRQHWSLIISTPPSAVHTNTHTFHSFPDRPPPHHHHHLRHHQLLSDCWKERGMKQTGGGGRRRKVRRDKGGRKGREEQLRFTLWAMWRHGRWVPEPPPPTWLLQ